MPNTKKCERCQEMFLPSRTRPDTRFCGNKLIRDTCAWKNSREKEKLFALRYNKTEKRILSWRNWYRRHNGLQLDTKLDRNNKS